MEKWIQSLHNQRSPTKTQVKGDDGGSSPRNINSERSSLILVASPRSITLDSKNTDIQPVLTELSQHNLSKEEGQQIVPSSEKIESSIDLQTLRLNLRYNLVLIPYYNTLQSSCLDAIHLSIHAWVYQETFILDILKATQKKVRDYRPFTHV